jgi:molecular chaperone DnaK (HSP70)
MSLSSITPRWCVGIDLGTSNTVVSICEVSENRNKSPVWRVLELDQSAGPGLVTTASSLPSMWYAPLAEERKAFEAYPELWDSTLEFLPGIYARDSGARSPDRVIHSSKSWLSHKKVDREALFLPPQVEHSIPRKSPVGAARETLAFLRRQLLETAHSSGATLASEVVVTIPASFDEVARSLTARAAREAGFENVVLLEEPQAAFYSWLGHASNDWRNEVAVGDCILVCDIGGGTTDFTLIQVRESEKGEVSLSRLAVGDHILLGGDNMDLALAYRARAELRATKQNLDTWQFQSLCHHVRHAKEALLSESIDSIKVTISSRSANLFATAIEYEITHPLVASTILEGFFPLVPLSGEVDESPSLESLSEFGLPYEKDPAITRHLAQFLSRNEAQPTHILFNGGVCKAPSVRGQILSCLESWYETPVKELRSSSHDAAVAEGASYYALHRTVGEGVRVQSGTIRSLYIGVERNRPAVPGIATELYGVCILPRGTEEGSTFTLPHLPLSIALNTPVQFLLYASDTKHNEAIGALYEDINYELEPMVTLVSSCSDSSAEKGERASVVIESTITSAGILEMALQEKSGARRWNLEFEI